MFCTYLRVARFFEGPKIFKINFWGRHWKSLRTPAVSQTGGPRDGPMRPANIWKNERRDFRVAPSQIEFETFDLSHGKKISLGKLWEVFWICIQGHDTILGYRWRYTNLYITFIKSGFRSRPKSFPDCVVLSWKLEDSPAQHWRCYGEATNKGPFK